MVDATIIVCTYNRAESLRRTLGCLANLHIPSGVTWEVVVVDNNSSDHTRTVITEARTSGAISELHYAYEPSQGLSYGRNRGIAESQGRVILFTDDDVCPDAEWLAATLAGMEQTGCDACGGYIAPAWPKEPPPWLTEKLYGFLAVRMDESGPREITGEGDTPFGANMAFRREVFEAVGRFDVSRGRVGGSLASGEDGELFSRLLAQGKKVAYLPGARVTHRIESERLKKSYFRRWRYQASRNIAVSRGVDGTRRIAGVPIYLFGQIWRATMNAIASRITGPADEAFLKEMILWHFAGMVSGLIATRHGRSELS